MALRTTITTPAEAPSDHLTLVVVGDGVLAATPLPHVGSIVLGRAPECDVRIDDASISRQHAELLLDPLRIIDKGSANGTRVRDQRIAPNQPVEIQVDEVVRLGNVTLIVQRRTVAAPRRRIRSHDYFENRLEDECDRALRHDLNFMVAHLVIGVDASLEPIVTCLRDGDIVATYAPGELELLLVDVVPEQGTEIVHAIEAALAANGIAPQVGSAWYPRDGRDPSALAARARSRAFGQVDPAIEGDVVVADERMAALHQLVSRVAAADISVLLQGETGVGKEVFAELIHRQSARAQKPFLKLNCAALTESLLESELFGHEKGAFTGAVQTKPGLLEVAEGGVIFLDEVGELQPSTQAKLLRVLDDRTLMRVGGVTPRAIDVRIVSATNRDLEAEVARGAFRLDLLYRLNAMSIVIPPLRERPGEIAALARQFVAAISLKHGRPAPRLGDDVIALLRAYNWPGNVRELRNAIERALVLCTGNVIQMRDLPEDKIRATYTPRSAKPRAPVEQAAVADDLAERQQILDALERCNGNQTHAARLLGIARRTLINKLEKFAVARPRKR